MARSIGFWLSPIRATNVGKPRQDIFREIDDWRDKVVRNKIPRRREIVPINSQVECYHHYMVDQQSVTQLLNRWSSGDKDAEAVLTPMVYDELQRMAKRLFRSEKSSHTLQPTALVHEAFVKLADVNVTWQDRAHFFSLAARMMRRLLVNHANARNAAKRGGGAIKVTLNESSVSGHSTDADLLDLEEALQALAELDPRKAELIELQYYGGLSFKEMEEVTGLSSSSLDRDLRMARAWLKDHLSKV